MARAEDEACPNMARQSSFSTVAVFPRGYRRLGRAGLPAGISSGTRCLLSNQGTLHSPDEAAAGRFVVNDDPALAEAIARQRLELGRFALLPVLAPPFLCSLAVALGITFLPASARQFWWLEVAIGAALLGCCLLLFERRIAKAAWTLARRTR